jgi:hypothetical protein
MNMGMVNPEMSKRFEPFAPAFERAAHAHRRGPRSGIRRPDTRTDEFSAGVVLERKRGVSEEEGTSQDMGFVIGEAKQVFK